MWFHNRIPNFKRFQKERVVQWLKRKWWWWWLLFRPAMVHANNLAFPRLSPHIPSLLAPFLFSPPLLLLSAQHDSIFRKKKPPPPEEYRILIEKCQELCSEKHKRNTRLFTRCMIDCMMEQNRFWRITVGQIGIKYKPTSLSL